MKKFFWGIPILSLLLFWMVFSSPYLVKSLVPFPSDYLVTFFPPWSASFGFAVKNNAIPDVISQIYPWKKLTIESWKLGQVPLWNPYSFSGTPHAANYQTAVFSPINALYLVLPHVDAWSVMILLQPLLAACFMYIFLRGLVISRASAVLGSVAFMFCGFMVVWMAYGTLGYAALFLPLILWALTYDKKFHSSRLIIASLGIFLSLVSGHFQISVYVILATLGWVWYQAFVNKQMLFAVWGTFYALIGIALAAPQLLLTGEAYANSVRSTMFTKGEIVPFSYLVTMFAPDFYGNPVTRNDWFGHYAEWSTFIGVVPLFFALLGAIHTKLRTKGFFLGLAIISLLCALPTVLNELIYALRIPVLSTSAASRIVVLASFGLSVLSALGMDMLIDFWKNNTLRKLLPTILTSVIFLVTFWLVVYLGRPLPADKVQIAIRNSLLPSLFFVIAITATCIGFFVKTKWRNVFIVLLLVTAMIDMYRFAAKWMPFVKKEHVFPDTQETNVISEVVKKDHARVTGNFGGEFHVFFGIPGFEGYDAVYNARYGTFVSSWTDGAPKELNRSVVQVNKQGVYTQSMLEMLGAKYYFHRISDGRNTWAYPFWNFPQYHSVWKNEVYELFQNDAALPRAYLASSYELASGGKDELQKTLTQGANADRIVLEKKPNIEPQSGIGAVQVASYTPNQVDIHVNTSVPKLLFLGDTYDPGWHVSVNGKKQELYRANYNFRAVAVPSGSSNVRMWYRPKAFNNGFIISGFATLLLLGLYLKRRKL